MLLAMQAIFACGPFSWDFFGSHLRFRLHMHSHLFGSPAPHAFSPSFPDCQIAVLQKARTKHRRGMQGELGGGMQGDLARIEGGSCDSSGWTSAMWNSKCWKCLRPRSHPNPCPTKYIGSSTLPFVKKEPPETGNSDQCRTCANYKKSCLKGVSDTVIRKI